MLKKIYRIISGTLATLVLSANFFGFALAQDAPAAEPKVAPIEANICDTVPEGYAPCATTPSQCVTNPSNTVPGGGGNVLTVPPNCLFLEEPIGGRNGFDLIKVNCNALPGATTIGCTRTVYNGEFLRPNERVVQAVLTFEPGREYEGPLTLLYNYVGLVYNYFSGVIIGVAVLFTIVGGIQMTTSAGDQGRFDAGKNRIVKAIVGVIIWFLASVILFTINPTFFSF